MLGSLGFFIFMEFGKKLVKLLTSLIGSAVFIYGIRAVVEDYIAYRCISDDNTDTSTCGLNPEDRLIWYIIGFVLFFVIALFLQIYYIVESKSYGEDEVKQDDNFKRHEDGYIELPNLSLNRDPNEKEAEVW